VRRRLNTDPTWPTHPDGRPLRVGEMTPAQRERLLGAAFRRMADSLREARLVEHEDVAELQVRER